MGTAWLFVLGLRNRWCYGTSPWSHLMVNNGMAQPLGLEPSAGCKREGLVTDEWHKTQAESGPAPQGWNGPMAEQPQACCPRRGDLKAEMGLPNKEDGMIQGLK